MTLGNMRAIDGNFKWDDVVRGFRDELHILGFEIVAASKAE
jgi:hypothetical protein